MVVAKRQGRSEDQSEDFRQNKQNKQHSWLASRVLFYVILWACNLHLLKRTLAHAQSLSSPRLIM